MKKKNVLSLVVVYDFDIHEKRYLLKLGNRLLYSHCSFAILVSYAFNYWINYEVEPDYRLTYLFGELSATLSSAQKRLDYLD